MAKKKKKTPKSLKAAQQDLVTKENLIHRYRKTICFNEYEMKAIREYCQRYHITNFSSLVRKSTMEIVLGQLEESSRLF